MTGFDLSLAFIFVETNSGLCDLSSVVDFSFVAIAPSSHVLCSNFYVKLNEFVSVTRSELTNKNSRFTKREFEVVFSKKPMKFLLFVFSMT